MTPLQFIGWVGLIVLALPFIGLSAGIACFFYEVFKGAGKLKHRK